MTTDNLPNEFMTSAEAARFLVLDIERVVYLAGIGKIPGAYKVGPTDKLAEWRFDVEKLKAYKKMREERKAELAGMMTAAEAAKFLRMNEEVIRRLTREGKIKAHKDDDGPRAEWRYAKEDLMKYLVPRFKE